MTWPTLHHAATPDQPHPNRHLVRPDYVPSSFQRTGAKTGRIQAAEVNKALLDAFKQHLDETLGKGDWSWPDILEDYMGWVLGIDCPDRPGITDAEKAEFAAQEKKGRRFGRYWADSDGGLSNMRLV